MTDATSLPGEGHNHVVLCGRVAAVPAERQLPSGDTIVTVRVVVDRDSVARRRSKQRIDTLDCVAWTAKVQRAVGGWEPGDIVVVEGALRRRFFRGNAGPASRFEVEVRLARRLRRASEGHARDRPAREQPA